MKKLKQSGSLFRPLKSQVADLRISIAQIRAQIATEEALLKGWLKDLDALEEELKNE
jgi:hypothetical protein